MRINPPRGDLPTEDYLHLLTLGEGGVAVSFWLMVGDGGEGKKWVIITYQHFLIRFLVGF